MRHGKIVKAETCREQRREQIEAKGCEQHGGEAEGGQLPAMAIFLLLRSRMWRRNILPLVSFGARSGTGGRE